MSNKVYDILKYIAIIVLPGLATLYLTVSGIWGLPFGEEVAATITAADTFLGVLLQISNSKYKKGEEELSNGKEDEE